MLDRKSAQEIKILRQGGQLLSAILAELVKLVQPGQTGIFLDQRAGKLIRAADGQPSFLNYKGFPASLCVSVNDTVVHGIPNDRPFREGDVVGLDIGMVYKKLYTDMAVTVPVGKVKPEVAKFIEITRQALQVGIRAVGPDKYIGDIGRAIEAFVAPYGYGIVRDLAGHGVGRRVHEDPLVPNFDPGAKLEKMFSGLVIAIEPMFIISGDHRVQTADNGWDVRSGDGSLTAHFEHSIAVIDKGTLVLTE